ncbi:hypothetical protein [Dysgonomonas sp. 520]|uniref:hypothetical protein n=1 Tax=Dysgonomonas sp. 520 TaxID=2302931 RepID=UPI0013D551A3|nr:hypothetical protein [Dysgonomonas sp. 520]NDW10620.1 hypothetical protein [Dysgonomonas sp. 520]
MNYYRKLLTFGLLVALTFSLSAQKGNRKGSVTGASTTEAQASKIIEYTNAVIELNNRQFDRLKDYRSVLKAGDAALERYKRNYDPRFPVSFTQTKYPVPAGYIAQYEEAEKKAPAFPEKAEIVQAVKNARASVAKLDEWSDKMGKYFKETQFTQDNFAQYPTIRDSVEYYLSDSRKMWRIAARCASAVGSEKENIFLKKSKVAPFIIPMKNDLGLMKDIVTELYDSVDDSFQIDKTVLPALKSGLDATNASLKKNEDLKGRNTSALTRIDDYKYFYSKAAECTKYYAKILDGFAVERPDYDRLDSDFRMLSQEYNNLIGIYNHFAERAGK